jgi:hypothetical protein
MQILRGTVCGGIAFFLLGWLVYGVLLMEYTKANTNQCAIRTEGEMVWWAMIVSNLLTALFLTLILKWSAAKGIVDGLKTGALFGILFALSIDLAFWSMTKIFNNFLALAVDVVANTLMMAVIGIIIVLLWGKSKAA